MRSNHPPPKKNLAQAQPRDTLPDLPPMKTENTTRPAITAEPASAGRADTAETIGRAIRTRYLCPTNCKGARIRAWVADDGKPLASVIVPWTYTGTASEEHERAALACLNKAREISKGVYYLHPVALIGAYFGNGEYAFAIRNA